MEKIIKRFGELFFDNNEDIMADVETISKDSEGFATSLLQLGIDEDYISYLDWKAEYCELADDFNDIIELRDSSLDLNEFVETHFDGEDMDNECLEDILDELSIYLMGKDLSILFINEGTDQYITSLIRTETAEELVEAFNTIAKGTQYRAMIM